MFHIPTFSYNTELVLRQGNEIYIRDGTLLTSPSVKSDILECLAEARFSYTAYPMMPRGLLALGSPELLINLLKHKTEDDRQPAQNISELKRKMAYPLQTISGKWLNIQVILNLKLFTE